MKDGQKKKAAIRSKKEKSALEQFGGARLDLLSVMGVSEIEMGVGVGTFPDAEKRGIRLLLKLANGAALPKGFEG